MQEVSKLLTLACAPTRLVVELVFINKPKANWNKPTLLQKHLLQNRSCVNCTSVCYCVHCTCTRFKQLLCTGVDTSTRCQQSIVISLRENTTTIDTRCHKIQPPTFCNKPQFTYIQMQQMNTITTTRMTANVRMMYTITRGNKN